MLMNERIIRIKMFDFDFLAEGESLFFCNADVIRESRGIQTPRTPLLPVTFSDSRRFFLLSH